MLLKSLGTTAGTPDLSLHDAQAGDRYLLCSDGLSAVVPGGGIGETLAAPETANPPTWSSILIEPGQRRRAARTTSPASSRT